MLILSLISIIEAKSIIAAFISLHEIPVFEKTNCISFFCELVNVTKRLPKKYLANIFSILVSYAKIF
jgi:hypothetical protein